VYWFRRLAEKIVSGKLPETAGRQLALPRETPRKIVGAAIPRCRSVNSDQNGCPTKGAVCV